MKYIFDIDGTICTNTGGMYSEAKPFYDRIAHINQLFEDGHTIVFFTARGMGRWNNTNKAEQHFRALTVLQLKEWKVKYHELIFGKPSGDFYIDDKGINANDHFS